MANEDLGTKRDCPECGARFYDLKREPALCPKCGNEFVPELILKPRRSRADEEAAKPAEQTSTDEDEEEDDLAAANVSSLDEAEQENAPAESKRKSALDEDGEDSEDDDVDDIDNMEVNIDEDDNTTILDDDDGQADLGSMVKKGGTDEDER